MRLWSIHPKYLDAPGLVAVWREGLLALKVLRGKTKGYRHHPQLRRFRQSGQPVGCIGSYLAGIVEEATRRGYSFDITKIPSPSGAVKPIKETRGQLAYEWSHFLAKLEGRNAVLHRKYRDIKLPAPHPLFRIVAGDVRSWERLR